LSPAGRRTEKRHPLPADVLTASTNGRVTVKFVSKVWVAGGVYGVRLMRPASANDRPQNP
jgi:hypothetical protein